MGEQDSQNEECQFKGLKKDDDERHDPQYIKADADP
eukprot:CAMPEP_0172857410 /NCGR_PEP_ID=MMETSP1075-20121228/64612_1 /TAXON_ID=2916 /ORGANISM="Ceratium fusus, Strain PA161109" /LENGTH=35 /DNA_ID= /DNA_START= /DNA_END= /DNA_ORIENTATION=